MIFCRASVTTSFKCQRTSHSEVPSISRPCRLFTSAGAGGLLELGEGGTDTETERGLC